MTERPSLTVDTPFGPMRAVFNRADQISLRDLTDAVWNPATKAHETGEPITVNGVQYRASFTFEHVNGQWKDTYCSLDRFQWRGKHYDYSQAAMRRVRESLAQIVAKLADTQTDTLRAAEIARLTDEFDRATQKAEKLAGELAQAEADVRRTREELTAAQAEAGQLDSEHMERRYLTRRELSKLAEHASTEQFAGYLTNYPHAIGNGACLEVALSVAQAREVDSLCELFQIGQ